MPMQNPMRQNSRLVDIHKADRHELSIRGLYRAFRPSEVCRILGTNRRSGTRRRNWAAPHHGASIAEVLQSSAGKRVELRGQSVRRQWKASLVPQSETRVPEEV